MTVWLGKFGVATRGAWEEHDGIPLYVPDYWDFFGLGPLVLVFPHINRWIWRIDR